MNEFTKLLQRLFGRLTDWWHSSGKPAVDDARQGEIAQKAQAKLSELRESDTAQKAQAKLSELRDGHRRSSATWRAATPPTRRRRSCVTCEAATPPRRHRKSSAIYAPRPAKGLRPATVPDLPFGHGSLDLVGC
jgi:hypothetical protein